MMKAKKETILTTTKNMLKYYLPILLRMPKIERIEGAPHEMKKSLFEILELFTLTYYSVDKKPWVNRLLGKYLVLLSCFEICLYQGLIPESNKTRLAELMSDIGSGIQKWRSYITSLI